MFDSLYFPVLFGLRAGGVPAAALRWDDGTPLRWDDNTYLLWS